MREPWVNICGRPSTRSDRRSKIDSGPIVHYPSLIVTDPRSPTIQDPAHPTLPGLRSALNTDVLALVADSVICTDEDGHIQVFNPAAEQAFGYAAGEVIGRRVELLLPETLRARHVQQVRDFASGDGSANRLMGHRREVRGRRKNGDEFPAEAMVSRQTIDGRTILTVVVRDITERKELEELREAAARELDHRMRNLLTVVQSLVSISAATAANVEEFRESLSGRLAALAATQSVLRFGEQQSTTLSDLFQAELKQYRAGDGANVVVEGPPISVGPKAAQLLALAVHELATNAAKYGALSDADGCVTLTSAFEGEGGGGPLLVQWREAGGPPVKPPERRGFGTRLITQVVAKALQADVTVDYLREGLVCRIIVPRAALEAGR